MVYPTSDWLKGNPPCCPPGASVTDVRGRVWRPHPPHYRRIVRPAPLPSTTFSTPPRSAPLHHLLYPYTIHVGIKWRPLRVSLELQASTTELTSFRKHLQSATFKFSAPRFSSVSGYRRVEQGDYNRNHVSRAPQVSRGHTYMGEST